MDQFRRATSLSKNVDQFWVCSILKTNIHGRICLLWLGRTQKKNYSADARPFVSKKSDSEVWQNEFDISFFLAPQAKILGDLETVLHWKHASGCILGCVFCVNYFLILQYVLPVVDIGPPRSIGRTNFISRLTTCSVEWLSMLRVPGTTKSQTTQSVLFSSASERWQNHTNLWNINCVSAAKGKQCHRTITHRSTDITPRAAFSFSVY